MLRQKLNRTLSILLTFVLLFSLAPTSLRADDANDGLPLALPATITAFAPLGDTANQTVPYAADITELILPQTLTAIIDGDEDNPVTVAVTWDSEPLFDGYQPGEYILSATVNNGDYIMDIAPPVIVVTVENIDQDGGFLQPADDQPLDLPAVVTAFEPLGDTANQTVPYATDITELDLPQTLIAIIDEDEDNPVTFAVTWECEPEFDGYLPDEYIFTAAVDIGDYIMDIAPPTITVTVEGLDPDGFFMPIMPLANNTREITIAMHDSAGDGWDGNGALKIFINGTEAHQTKVYNSTALNNPSGQRQRNIFTFEVNTNDAVQLYWVAGSAQSENAFAVYYSDAPPSSAFVPAGSGHNNCASEILFCRHYSGLTSAANGELLFTLSSVKINISGTSNWTLASGYSAPAPLSVTIVNGSNDTLTDVNATITGLNADAFSLDLGSFTSSVSAGEQTSLFASPNEGLTTGYYSAVLTVTAGNTTQVVPLKCAVDISGFGLIFSPNNGNLRKTGGDPLVLADYGMTWNSATSTLTMENLKFMSSNAIAMTIESGANVKLNLIGDNELTSVYQGSGHTNGLFTQAITIGGSGTLTVRAGTGSGNSNSDRSAGIRSSGNMTINSGTINTYGGVGGRLSNGMWVNGVLTINDGVINAYADTTLNNHESTGISAETGLNMNGGRIYADCKPAANFSSGFYSYSGYIKINGGT
ncbi:MAG: carbohydrate-binding domain-containing protein, partial [Lachnospiraceae bacterium]|nr:carbohydrate-binding domain-containing protein [Lachnospiraceae bacterium]